MTTLKSILKEAIEEVLTCNLSPNGNYTCWALSEVCKNLINERISADAVYQDLWTIDDHIKNQVIPFLYLQGVENPTSSQTSMLIHALVFRDLDIGDAGKNYTSDYINSIVANHKDKCDELFKYYRIEWLNFLLENLDSLEE